MAKKVKKEMSVAEFDKRTLGGFHTLPYENFAEKVFLEKKQALIARQIKGVLENNKIEATNIFNALELLDKQNPCSTNKTAYAKLAMFLQDLIKLN